MDINCDDAAEVANLEVPVAKFYKDDFKLHRRGLSLAFLTDKNAIFSDVGLALIKYNPTFKKMNQKDKSQFLDEFEGKKSRISVKFKPKSVGFPRAENGKIVHSWPQFFKGRCDCYDS